MKKHLPLNQWFSSFVGGDTYFENKKPLEYPTFKQMPNCMYQKLKVKVWNNMAIQKKLATLWLRTTALRVSSEDFYHLKKLSLAENDRLYQGIEQNDPKRNSHVAQEHLLQEGGEAGHREWLHRRGRRQ